MEERRTIAVEGVIGAGKTSLATFLAKRLGGRLVLEEVEENPFLPLFYEDRERFAFSTQVFFLMSRYRQQQQLGRLDLFEHTVVSDYLFAKDRIFASVNLNEQEWVLYERLAGLFVEKTAPPDVVVYLQANTETLIGRIARRGREYERDMEVAYIRALGEAYNQFFFHYTASPLLVVNTSGMDFAHREKDLEEVFEQVRTPFKGTRYYVPMGGQP
ncbi:MAG: deoxynucleoside kinase [Candidatus Latescibacterota bacterium]|nr:MAG: deoxynucleoside kinase [Candidatus Latescibacteria bacterium 4484_107]RKY69009.1 MAG: deoxynucleoside kinase [Candidatus Latescibacterota bacterium]